MNFTDLGNHDFLAHSASLRRHGQGRTFFDPLNPLHVQSMAHYLKTGNWTIHFYPEEPYTDVPTTVLRKFAGVHVGVPVTLQQKQAASAAASMVIDAEPKLLAA